MPLSPEWGHRGDALQGQPEKSEIVIEDEAKIGPDGKIRVVIDTQTAKELHGNQDHKYTITAEIADQSRRTIVGTGSVLVSSKPFTVYTWLDKGHYRAGDTVRADFRAQTVDAKPVQGKGELTLYQISYNDKNEPVEKAVQTWKLDTNIEGSATQQLHAAKPGQFRLSYQVTDGKNNTIKSGYVFLVRGEGFDGKSYRFNDIEIVADRKEYKPGDKVKLNINTNKAGSTVLLFARPTNGIYLAPKILRLQGKSIEEEIAVVQRDMPNFFVEAMTIADGQVHTALRELAVPPEKRILKVEVMPSQQEYKPGQKANVKLKLTEADGKPYQGSTVVSIYDKSVEYVSGGSNVPDIKEAFWKWRRHHHSQGESSLVSSSSNLLRRTEFGMRDLGTLGSMVTEEIDADYTFRTVGAKIGYPAAAFERSYVGEVVIISSTNVDTVYRRIAPMPFPTGKIGNEPPESQPSVRKNFADTALWNASLTTDKNGIAETSLTMPDQLTAWKIRVWALGHGTVVGEGTAEITTKKDLLVRLQSPRFVVQKDEVVLSANVHNYLKAAQKIRVSLELDGNTLAPLDPLVREITLASGGESRVDWLVKVRNEGQAVVRMKAVSAADSDAVEMRFPCLVHGMLKMDAFAGVIRPDKDVGKINFDVPAERRGSDSMLEVRYSPTLAGAMIDALPYLVDYPYGCTEQTLKRFLPTVITQRLLQDMKVDLKEIEKHQTNLNSQELGDARTRIKGWMRASRRNPVFDEAEVRHMSEAGIRALRGVQLSDGGWGWFSGRGEYSWPHTTATVVHGLQLAKQNNVKLPPGMLERGIAWLQEYQEGQLRLLRNGPTKTLPYKEHADNIDALVYMTLADADIESVAMRDYLCRDRTHLAVYAKAMFGLALHKQGQKEKLAMIMQNIEQYLVQGNENQTAYLRMPESNQWWCWHGNEIEANAYYLKLLTKTNARDERASRLVKYLLNNRRHATYWNSTRDTAICVEAFADYLKTSGEDRPDMSIEVWLDGKKHKDVRITRDNLFSFDNKLVLVGDKVTTGNHTLEIKRKGSGPVYFNAYVTYFTLEDFITRSGLEVKVHRTYFKLTRIEQNIKVSGSKGQALDQQIEKYKRTELQNLAMVKSGDLIEVELEIDSKNDYEYLIFEDPKAAGFEPLAEPNSHEFGYGKVP